MSAPADRCGKPLRRLERGGRAILEDPECGRPEGHRGRCRSAQAVARYYAQDALRITEARRDGRYGRPWLPARRAA